MHTSIKLVICFLLFIGCGRISAHELTPTYVDLKQSYVQNVLTTKLMLWNGRADVLYYKVLVYDKDFKELPFVATPGKIIKVEYSKRQELDVFLGAADARDAVYICTRSQILKGLKQKTVISSKICSKIK